jgi:hypothetical protein
MHLGYARKLRGSKVPINWLDYSQGIKSLTLWARAFLLSEFNSQYLRF